MKAIIPLSLLMLIAAPCAYGWQQHDLEVRTDMFNDSDGTHSFTFEQVFHLKDKASKIGFGATETVINELGGSRVFSGGLLEGYRKLDNVDFTGKLKLLSWNGTLETPVTLGSSQTLGAFRLEENVDHGTIDSVRAYDARIEYWSAGGSLDWSPLKEFTVTGGYWRRWSSDSNSRDLYIGKATYSFTDNFHAQYRYRGIRNAEKVPQYYSPRFFDQHALLVGYADSFYDRLRVKLWVGPFSQDDGFTTSVGALEDLKITWRINDHWLAESRVEADQIGSGYHYVYATVGVTYGF